MTKDRSGQSPVPSGGTGTPAARPDIATFLARARTLAPPPQPGCRGRLIFALDATMSRQPTWDTACQLQSEMFREAAAAGGLDVQLVYYRGEDQCAASRWTGDTKSLT